VLQYASLNSGSNGNCYYIGNNEHAVLVDAGLSRKETLKRMERLGLDPQKLRAIIISHEHTDHVIGLAGLAKKHFLPVYISKGTHTRVKRYLGGVNTHIIHDEKPVLINDLLVYPFKKFHDAASPFSFVIEYNEKRVGVFTDIGQVCEPLKKYFSSCHAAFLETNYDNVMLREGRYPLRLKERIRGGEGHLSNHQALQLFCEHRHRGLKHVLLAHLSAENNDPDLAKNLFQQHAGMVRIDVASRYNESEVFMLDEVVDIPAPLEQLSVQLQLF
jgi:phosphoribosyl 1,2-cyclic phosphodiesterase